jgi:hypothetical protein
MKTNWIPLIGEFEITKDALVFQGRLLSIGSEQEIRQVPSVGIALADVRYAGGSIEGTVTFENVDQRTAGELLIYRDPRTDFQVTAGLGGSTVGMYTVRHYDGKTWTYHRDVGDRANLKSGRSYDLRVTLRGSRVSLHVDGIEVTAVDLPFTLGETQPGIWCLGQSKIEFTNLKIDASKARAFVIMQFSSPYNEIYSDVIRQICKEFDLEVIRADEEYGPGVIVADVARQIAESKVVIAEITPANPNVYYEVGYAHALNKATILIAERPTKLPFDVAPHRVLFYENTINGKARLEEGLRRHLSAILADQAPSQQPNAST